MLKPDSLTHIEITYDGDLTPLDHYDYNENLSLEEVDKIVKSVMELQEDLIPTYPDKTVINLNIFENDAINLEVYGWSQGPNDEWDDEIIYNQHYVKNVSSVL